MTNLAWSPRRQPQSGRGFSLPPADEPDDERPRY